MEFHCKIFILFIILLFCEKFEKLILKGKEIITDDEENEEESGPGFLEQIATATETIGKFIYKNSYIFTNVVMMVSDCKIY